MLGINWLPLSLPQQACMPLPLLQSAPAVPTLHVLTLCLSHCVDLKAAAWRLKPGVPLQPVSTLHPPSQQCGSSIAAACLLTIPPAKTSTLTACHSPDISGMSCPSPQSPDNLSPSFIITTSSEDVNWCSAAGCPCCWVVPVDKPQEPGMVVASRERKWFPEQCPAEHFPGQVPWV